VIAAFNTCFVIAISSTLCLRADAKSSGYHASVLTAVRRILEVGLSNPFMQFVSRIENAALQNRARDRPGIALTNAVPSE
jgi:hypothetical protein